MQVAKYFGRAVLRGDSDKDGTGCQAAFLEQGASASPMTAATVLDSVFRPPEMGEGNDEVPAYAQVNAARLLMLLETDSTFWIRLPCDCRLTQWDMIDGPVVLSDSTLYAHPWTGLLWRMHTGRITIARKCGEDWAGELFLSGNVDDIKKEHVAKKDRLRCGQHCERRSNLKIHHHWSIKKI